MSSSLIAIAARLARRQQPRGALDGLFRRPAALTGRRADVPDLRPHLAAGRMDRLDHAAPARQRRFAVEKRDAGFVARGRTVDHGPFGQDQADLVLGPAAVIGGVGLAGDTLGRARARHRRHNDSVFEGERLDAERLEERGNVSHVREAPSMWSAIGISCISSVNDALEVA
jgi:hypothetical protein